MSGAEDHGALAPVEPDAAPGYQRFDCTGDDPETLAAGTEAARDAVERGECIVLPTDTVYGIGADAFSPEAVQRLLDAKRRGRDMPPPVLIADASLIRALATDVPDTARELVEAHWPGPLTVILQRQPSLRMDLGETEGTVALRVPDHELAREVLRCTGPMAVSSANLSGRAAALSADEAIEQLEDTVAVYLDGGRVGGDLGAPSTIVDFTRSDAGQVLRRGALSVEILRGVCPGLEDLTAPDPADDPGADGPEADGPEADETEVDDPEVDETNADDVTDEAPQSDEATPAGAVADRYPDTDELRITHSEFARDQPDLFSDSADAPDPTDPDRADRGPGEH